MKTNGSRNSLAYEGQLWRRTRDHLLAAMPELADDEECLVDTVDGETGLDEAVGRIAQSVVMDKAIAAGLADTIKKLQEKKASHSDRARRKTAAIFNLMDDLGRSRIVSFGITCSIQKNPPSVGQADIDQLPKKYIRTTREPDRKAILAALKAGKTIKGAQLSNQATRLSIK